MNRVLKNYFFVTSGKNGFSFTTSLEDGIRDAAIVFLALPTPQGEDGSADLKYVLGVANDLGKILNDYKIIIDKSTVPVALPKKCTPK